MAKVQQTVYLVTEQQRDALINYLQNRPFREVAAGIQFLMNAPTAVLNVNAPDENQVNGVSEAQLSQLNTSTEALMPEIVSAPEELIAV